LDKSYTPDDYLEAFNSFWATATRATNSQISMARKAIRHGGMLTIPNGQGIAETITHNVLTAAVFTRGLGNAGLRIMIEVGEEVLPVEGYRFDDEDGYYAALVVSPQMPTHTLQVPISNEYPFRIAKH
jgi:hypothetical protein